MMMHTLDVVIIIVYLLLTVVIGISFRGRQESESDYFTAQGGFSKWLGMICVGLSIGATFFSGISVTAYPSIVYKQGIPIFLSVFMLPISGIVVYFWFLPRFLKKMQSEPYGLIEEKFGYPTRAVAAGLYLMMRVSWMAVLIYAPVVALMAGIGLEDRWFWPLVLLVGLSSTIYTVLGGIRGVIVTDAIQFLVMLLGILGPIVYVAWNLPVSMADAVCYLQDQEKLIMFKTSLSFTEPMTVWSLIAGYLIANLAMYMADQMSLQRFMTAGTIASARRAFVVNIAGVMLVIGLLVLLGLALKVWYGMGEAGTTFSNADHVFPTFIVTELPVGSTGLILAAILAATMSSMTSGINTLAAVITLDFASRFSSELSPRQRLRFAKGASLIIGLMATFVAGQVRNWGSIFDIAQALPGIFAGPLLVCVVLSMLKFSLHPWSVIGGMLIGCLTGWGVVCSPANSMWVAPASALITLMFALITSGGGLLGKVQHHSSRINSVAECDAGVV